MNAPQTFSTAPGFAPPAEAATPEALRDARGHAWRHDGWTPDRQRTFLARIAEGHTVDDACRTIGLAPSSAYALRRRAGGAAFALGWQAAALLARDHIADALVARAIDGQTDTVTRADGSTVTRHRFDNRLATAMLTRLDRLADASANEGTHHAARMIAGDWEAYLDLVGQDGGPARAGLFLGARAGDEATPVDLAPIVTLARADHYLRTGAATAAELDTADLDPATRAHWTAEQWARAEAAGLLILAPEPAPEPEPSPKPTPAALQKAEFEAMERALYGTSPLSPLDAVGAPVWYDDIAEEWRTEFAPPEGFAGDEEGAFGDDDYARTLTPAEEALVVRANARANADYLARHRQEREAWFLALLECGTEAAGAEEPDVPDEEDGAVRTEQGRAERADAPPVEAP